MFRLRSWSLGVIAMLIAVFSLKAADDVRIHGSIIQWHRDPTTEATFSWVQRLSTEGTKFRKWLEGTSGFGYGDEDDATVLDSMKGEYERVYITKQFNLIGRPATGTQLNLDIMYDDAFICYINGVEVARSKNIENSGAKADVEDTHENEGPERFAIAVPEKILKAGPNMISIEGHNRRKISSDFSLEPRLLFNDEVLIERATKWLYLAGRDPDPKWYLVRPDVREIGAPYTSEKAEFQLVLTPRDGGEAKEFNNTSEDFGDTDNPVFTAKVDGLTPDTPYSFTLAANGKAIRTGWFRTAPAFLTKPLTFVAGGDMGTASAEPVCKLAGREDPMFGYLGGDLAYANGKEPWKWYDWIDNWVNLVTTKDGRYVPMVAVIGNHEMKPLVKKGDSLIKKKERAPYYFTLFDLPNLGDSNFTVDFGKYMSLIILDSNHAQKIKAQTNWLAKKLEGRKNILHVFPNYHRPAWGTGVKGNIKEIQEDWSPLFEKYQVACVFENDHHVYKRTYKITGGRRDDERGILYLGDGAWGATVRPISDAQLNRVGAKNYLAKWSSSNHLIRVTVSPDGTRTYQAKIADGTIIDQFVDKP